VRLNPFDLPAGDRRPDALTQRALFLHTVIAVLTGGTGGQPAMTAGEKAALDRAIIGTYQQAGITADPSSWDRAAPLLRDLTATLESDRVPAAESVAAKLAPWTTGSFKDLFDGPTTLRPDGHLVVWSLRHLADELKTIGTLLALDSIWRQVDSPAPRYDRRIARPPARRLRRPAVALTVRPLRRGFLLSNPELASIAGLPTDLAVPGLARARAKAAPAPTEVPTGGRNTLPLGRAEAGDHAVALPVADARHHLHVLGSTGVGKSTLLLNLVLAQIHAGRGVVVIDPRGDLVTYILDWNAPAGWAGRSTRSSATPAPQPSTTCGVPRSTGRRSSTRTVITCAAGALRSPTSRRPGSWQRSASGATPAAPTWSCATSTRAAPMPHAPRRRHAAWPPGS
jgi:hypothetical protein